MFPYTTLYITHVLFPSCFNTQLCISPTLYFSPVSVYKTEYHPRSTSLLFSTQHFISPTFHFPPVSVHNTVYHPRSISLLFQYTTLYLTHPLFLSCFITQPCISHTLYFSPVSLHNTSYLPRSTFPLFQYTTLYINHALFLSCFSTQHCVSAKYGIVCFLNIQFLEFLLLFVCRALHIL